MGKGQDAKKNVKKAPEKTAKEKKQEKRLKKSKQEDNTTPKLQFQRTNFRQSSNKRIV